MSAPWEAASATGWASADDAGWPSAAEPRRDTGGQDGQRWGSASGDAPDWTVMPDDTAAAATAPWEPAAEPPSWGSADPAEPTEDSGPAWQRSAWRPSAQTETFPAVTEE